MRQEEIRPMSEPREIQLISDVLKSTEDFSHEEINNFFNELRKELIERRLSRIQSLELEIDKRNEEIRFARDTMKTVLTAQI